MCGSLQVLFFSLDTETRSQTIMACFLSLLNLVPLIVRQALEIKLSSQAHTHTRTDSLSLSLSLSLFLSRTHTHTFIMAACTLFSCRCEGHPPGPFHEALPFLSVCSRPFSFNHSGSRTPPHHWQGREAPPHTSLTC